MSDVMLLGVLRMPMPDYASGPDALAWLQLRDRARQAADRIEADGAEIARLRAALLLAQRMCHEALPKFNWSGSCLDANAIDLLNRAPASIAMALGPNVELTGRCPRG